jgi:hypothetical protein
MTGGTSRADFCYARLCVNFMGWNVHIGQVKFQYCLWNFDSNCPVFCAGFIAWAPHLFHGRATPVIVGWFAARKWKNNSNWYTKSPKSLSYFYTVYTVYKCGRCSHAPWRLRFGDPCFTVYWDRVIGLALCNRLRFPAAFPMDISNLPPSRGLGNLTGYMHDTDSFISAFKR